MHWCNFAKLTSCRIRLHISAKKLHNRAMWGKRISFVKSTVIQILLLTYPRVVTLFLTTDNFLTKYSSILKSSLSNMIFTRCKYCSAVGRYIKFCNVFSCCFTAARSNVIQFHDTCYMIEQTWKRTRLAGHVTRFKMAENNLHDLFSFKSFCICAKNQKINE